MNLQFRPSNMPPPEPLVRVILASQSVGRKTLLEKLGIPFRVAITRIDEDKIVDVDPLKMIRRRAAAKANEVAEHPRMYSVSENGKHLVVAGDSMAVIGKKTFGKARDRDDARTITKALMGKTHTFVTAMQVILLEGHTLKKQWEKIGKTKVTLRKLTAPELESYIGRFDFTRFAAGYALNETPWDLVTKIEGSYTNVVGLPFESLLPILRSLKIIA